MEREKCTYCERESFVDSFMTEKHLEMTIFKARLEKIGLPITMENIQMLMRTLHKPVAVTIEEVPVLFAQMQTEAVPA